MVYMALQSTELNSVYESILKLIMPYALSEKHQQLVEGHLADTDPEVDRIIKARIDRQKHSIVLIA